MGEKHGDILVRLNWHLSCEGRNKIIPTHVYGCDMKFENNEMLWSVVILFNKDPIFESDNIVVELAFLFRENLNQKLIPGKKIFIYEGPSHLMAEGEIIKEIT